MPHLQDDVLRRSLDAPDDFWARQAEHLVWHTPPAAALGRARGGWQWFPGGEISTCYNCLDRHVEAGRGDEVAVYYDSPVTGAKERFTYARLLDEVEVLAGALRELGVAKGDVVMLYSASRVPPRCPLPSAQRGAQCP